MAKKPNPKNQEVQLRKIQQALTRIKSAFDGIDFNINMPVQKTEKLTKQIDNLTNEYETLQEQIVNISSTFGKFKTKIGNLDDDIVNHSRNLMNLAKSYANVSVVGKAWLNSVDYSKIIKSMKSSIVEYQGIFVKAYTKMANVAMTLVSNVSKVGTADFNIDLSQIQSMDAQIQKLQQQKKYSLSSDDMDRKKEQLKLHHDILTKLNEKTSLTKDDVANLEIAKQKYRQISEQISKSVLLQDGKQQQLETNLQHLQNTRLQLIDMNQRLSQANVQLKPVQSAIAGVGSAANDIKQSILSLASIGSITFPGIKQIGQALDFNKLVKPIQSMVAQTWVFLKLLKGAKLSFKDIVTGFSKGVQSIVKSMSTLLIGLSKSIITGFISIVSALFTTAMQFSDRLQKHKMGVQSSAGALTGAGQSGDFNAVYQKTGGLIGGQKAAEIYNTYKKVSDTVGLIGDQVQFLERKLAVTATTSAGFLQNMKYVYNLSQQQAGNMAILASNTANQLGVLPQKLMKQLAQASGQVTVYLGRSTKSLQKSAFFAAKMNMSMQDLLKAAKGFDDIEKSIQKSMQIQLLTGKKLNIGQMIRLNALGRGPEAVAMVFDQLGDSIQTTVPAVRNAIMQILGMDWNTITSAYNIAKQQGRGFQEILAQMDKLAQQNEQKRANSMQNIMGMIQTAAVPLLTRLEALQLRISQIINKHFGKFVDMFHNNTGDIMGLFDTFVGYISEKLSQLLQWIRQPRNQQALQDLFQSAIKFAKQFAYVIDNVARAIGWVIEKFGIFGVVLGTLAITNLGGVIKLLFLLAKSLGKVLFATKAVTAASATTASATTALAGGFSATTTTLGATTAATTGTTAGIGGLGAAIWAAAAPVLVFVAALAAALAVFKLVTVATYSLAKAFSNNSIGYWREQLEGQVSATKKLIDVNNKMAEAYSTRQQTLKSAIDIQTELKNKTNLTKLEQEKLKNSYQTLTSSMPWLATNAKSASKDYKMSIQSMKKATEQLQKVQLEKYKAEQEAIKRTMLLKRLQLAQQMDKGFKIKGISAWFKFNATNRQQATAQVNADFSVASTMVAAANYGSALDQIYKTMSVYGKALSDENRTTILQQVSSIAGMAASSGQYDVSKKAMKWMQRAAQGDYSTYATGGIVDKPHLGLVGQAGAEAIIPLRKSVFQDLGLTNNDNQSSSKQSENLIGKIAAAISSVTHAVDNKPIQITLNLDGKPLAQYLLRNGAIAQKLG